MPKVVRCAILGLLLFVWLIPAACLPAAPPAHTSAPETQRSDQSAEQPKFMRVVRDENAEPVALQTATARYVKSLEPAGVNAAESDAEKTVIVDLIGAVHVADRSYYEQLNEQFEDYDVLLYELVAEADSRPSRGGGGGDVTAMLRGVMQSVLELDDQLARIDYTKPNFVHADLSPSQLAEAMRKRGDNALTIFLEVFAEAMRQQNRAAQNRRNGAPAGPSDFDVLAALFDPNGSLKLKRILAEQFDQLGPSLGLGRTLDRLLIADRNKAAVRVLQREVEKGRVNIGIFYGAAHMPDFEKRLTELGYRRESEQWTTAWDLSGS